MVLAAAAASLATFSSLIVLVGAFLATTLVRLGHLGYARSASTEWHASLLERGLQKFRVELAADRSEKRFNLRQLHVLHILSVCHHLRLVGEHLGCHASNDSLGVLIELILLLVLVVIVASLVALLLVAVLATWPTSLIIVSAIVMIVVVAAAVA